MLKIYADETFVKFSRSQEYSQNNHKCLKRFTHAEVSQSFTDGDKTSKEKSPLDSLNYTTRKQAEIATQQPTQAKKYNGKGPITQREVLRFQRQAQKQWRVIPENCNVVKNFQHWRAELVWSSDSFVPPIVCFFFFFFF